MPDVEIERATEPAELEPIPAPPPGPGEGPREGRRRRRRRAPLRIRSVPLWTLALLAVMTALYIGRAVLLPITAAILMQLILSPVVRALLRVGVPAALGAALVLVSVVGLTGYGVYQLAGPAGDWMAELPRSIDTAQEKLHKFKAPLEKVAKATEEIEDATTLDSSSPAPPVQVQDTNLARSLVGGAGVLIVNSFIAIVLVYFLLAGQDSFLRSLVRVLPRLQDKKTAVEVLRGIETQISRCLLTITTINLCLGVAVAAAVWACGMPNPLLWGAMAAVFNFVPYFGTAVGIVILALAALLTFDTAGQALLPPLCYFVLSSLEGMLITPVALGRSFTIKPVVIFVWLMLWGWMWGVPGALVAVPILIAFKILCDNLPVLSPVGEFLSR